MKSISFNVSFRAWGPSCSRLVFEIRDSHSLAHTFVEDGFLGSDLSASAKVDPKEGFQHKSARIHWTRV